MNNRQTWFHQKREKHAALGIKMTGNCAFIVTNITDNVYLYDINSSFIELVSMYSHRLMWIPSSVKEFRRIHSRTLLDVKRQRGGTHDNPNLWEFQKNNIMHCQALRVVNSFAKGPTGKRPHPHFPALACSHKFKSSVCFWTTARCCQSSVFISKNIDSLCSSSVSSSKSVRHSSS